MLGLCLLQAAVASEPQEPLVLEERRASWEVYEGFDVALTAPAFAARVGDLETLSALSRERDAARRRKALLVFAGVAMMGSSALPWFLEDYASVEGITDADLSPGVNLEAVKHNQRIVIEEDRAWAGAVLATGGLMIAVSGPLAWRGALERQAVPENYYALDQAQTLVEDYNQRLAAPAAPESPEAPEALEALETPEAPEVPEALGGAEALLTPAEGPLGLTGIAGGW